MIGTLLQDIRFSVRGLLKKPAFTLVAVLSLALGIGANTTIFTLVNTILLNPLPVEDPSSLYAVFTQDEANAAAGLTQVSFPNYEDLRDQNEAFEALAAYGFPIPTAMLVGEEPEQVFTEIVSGNYFRVLSIEPTIGRFILPEEDRVEGASPVAVLSYGLWTRRFGQDPSVIHRTITINGVSYDVVGVAPEGFKGVNALFSPDVWVPMMMYREVLPAQFHEWFEDRRALLLNVFGRLPSGATPEEAQAHLKTIAASLEAEYPEPNKGRTIEIRPLTEATIFPGFRGMLVGGGVVLMSVVGLVLLIACFNVANLLLSQASSRRKEIAVRLSLGAGRSRLMRQLLSESLILGLMGGALGLLVAFWGKDLIWSTRPPFLAQNVVELALDGRVLLFTLGVSLLTGVLFGLIPAIQGSRAPVVDALKEETRTAGRARGRFSLRNGLVVAQVALSIISLVVAGLFLRSLETAHRLDPGFETEKLAVMTVNLGQAGYDPPQGRAFYDAILTRLRAEPGLSSAAWATNLPLFGGFQRSVFLEGQPEDESGILVLTNQVDDGFFATSGTPLLRGRDFTPVDREDSPPVAIVNEQMARDFWPDSEPIGKRFRFYGDDFFHEVVGIVATAKYVTLGEDPQSAVYLPRRQSYADSMVLYLRTEGDPSAALALARERFREADRRVPVTNSWTISEVIDQSLWAPKLGAILFACMGALALALASIGLYGVMAYHVSQRNQEIGLRMALGAAQKDVLGMVMKQAMALVGLGCVIGLVLALSASSLVSTLLFGSARDPLTFAGVPLVLATVAFVASLLPAIRASRVDPLVALRHQ
ncbi:MAG TPA: ABC transporter permease [Vicinamibacteria bacterium]|nr:ABC transporter permease [Vicinamibacteria bacterium]